MEDIFLVTGCHRTRSWAVHSFNNIDTTTEFSLAVDVASVSGSTVHWRDASLHSTGVFMHHGPCGEDLPENQCLFVRGFRVKCHLGGLRSRVITVK